MSESDQSSRSPRETFSYWLDDDERFSEGVIAAASAVLASDNTEINGIGPPENALDPLYSSIDPDALDAVFRSTADGDSCIVFPYSGYEITVHSYGLIKVGLRNEASPDEDS